MQDQVQFARDLPEGFKILFLIGKDLPSAIGGFAAIFLPAFQASLDDGLGQYALDDHKTRPGFAGQLQRPPSILFFLKEASRMMDRPAWRRLRD